MSHEGGVALNCHLSSPLVDQWLHGRPPRTTRAYRWEITRFLAFAGEPVALTTADVQRYADSLAHLAPATQARALAAAKSFLAYAHEAEAIPRDVGRRVKLPPRRDTLTERILSRTQVRAILDGEPDARARAMILTLYTTGMRVSELCGLHWRDCTPATDGGEETATLTIFGKGGKTRFQKLHPPTWAAWCALTPEDARERNRRVWDLSPRTAERIVATAGERVGLHGVSPHWMRHAFATHSLDGGMPVHELQALLGHASLSTTSKYLHSRPERSAGRYLGL